MPDATPAEPEIREKVVYKPTRKRLPDERPSITHKFSIAGHEGYLTVGLYPETEQPGEIFITIAKQGSTLAGMMDAFATSVSIALQYGVPLEDLCRKFSHMRFEPSGFTNNKQIPIAKSMMDYIFRYLAIKFLDAEAQTSGAAEGTVDPNMAAGEHASRSGEATSNTAQAELDFGTMQPTSESPSSAPTETPVSKQASEIADDESLVGQTIDAFMDAASDAPEQQSAMQTTAKTTYKNQEDSPPCANCGTITVRSGACYICPACGTTTGCG
jgi:ribonucleoside-diphosphate reductase alpha chain